MQHAYYLVAVMMLNGHSMDNYTPVARIHEFKNNLHECDVQKASAIKAKMLWSPNPSYSVKYVCMPESQWAALVQRLHARH